ncbi:MAG: flagellar hook-basal body complex protein [Desulfitobacteriaceae bacterium]|nr:flagellar hook-basal body complex protein [Desulfitobacteriaceae bacterium]MDI6879190.1 flagellar hook-basal body complex protein [Desulfitobacteriaceae bacterium]MDI6914959.1 flagellar hook-basal body complex protein [Desulfitobacteriaceae bacterium]
MMRSLYSAISGLKNHQIKMDVIGNNIANVNTTGFKRSRVSFGTMLSQTVKGASTPDTATPATYGGTNPTQIGLGATLGSIDQIMSQGSAQSTGKNTDLMIQGSGFFVLKNSGNTVYTRAGGFGFDSDGNMVDPATGALVQGYIYDATQADATWSPGPVTLGNIKFKLGDPSLVTPTSLLTSYSIDQNGIITGVYTDPSTGTSTTNKIAQIPVANFANDSGLQNIGSNFYTQTNNSGTGAIGAAGTNGRGTLIPGALEMSNVDLSQEFTDMIVTQRGFQANSRVITVSDTLLQELIDLKRQ